MASGEPTEAEVDVLVQAFMIYAEWPISGLWVIGMFVPIETLMQGICMVAEARAAHKALD